MLNNYENRLNNIININAKNEGKFYLGAYMFSGNKDSEAFSKAYYFAKRLIDNEILDLTASSEVQVIDVRDYISLRPGETYKSFMNLLSLKKDVILLTNVDSLFNTTNFEFAGEAFTALSSLITEKLKLIFCGSKLTLNKIKNNPEISGLIPDSHVFDFKERSLDEIKVLVSNMIKKVNYNAHEDVINEIAYMTKSFVKGKNDSYVNQAKTIINEIMLYKSNTESFDITLNDLKETYKEKDIVNPYEELDKGKAKALFDAAKKGDELAKETIAECSYYLGMSIAQALNMLDLDLVLIGGGLCKDFDMMIEHINSGVRNYGLRMMVNNVEIKPASLGNDAGVLGCAALFFRNN